MSFFQGQERPSGVNGVLHVLELWQVTAVVFLGLVAYSVYQYQTTKIDLPAIGVPPGIFGPWKAALTFVTNSESLMRQGYEKYGKEGKAFKISTPARYMVLLSDPKMIKELTEVDENILSFRDGGAERISLDYTFSHDLHRNPYHIKLILNNLTTRLSSILPEVLGELITAFEDNTKIGPEWTEVENFPLMLRCISRTTNRLFVGFPLCRDQDYLDSCVEFATRASFGGAIIDMFPRIFKPIVARVVFDRNRALNKTIEKVGPILRERQQKLQRLGDGWARQDRPNDAIQWILEADPNGTIRNMCLRLLFLNFVSIHTTSFSISNVLYDLAAHPEYQEPLKQEIEATIAEFGGWTKQALTKMKKLDSVLRESQRVNSIALLSGVRRVNVPHTFSDGTRVPAGTWVLAPSSSIHKDSDIYENAQEFDGFRFSNLREQPGHEAKHQMVSTSLEYLSFGIGKHACPGRFFAANELKILLGYIICNYEFKFENGKRPKNFSRAYSSMPDCSAKILYRERVDRKDSFASACMRKTLESC